MITGDELLPQVALHNRYAHLRQVGKRQIPAHLLPRDDHPGKNEQRVGKQEILGAVLGLCCRREGVHLMLFHLPQRLIPARTVHNIKVKPGLLCDERKILGRDPAVLAVLVEVLDRWERGIGRDGDHRVGGDPLPILLGQPILEVTRGSGRDRGEREKDGKDNQSKGEHKTLTCVP